MHNLLKETRLFRGCTDQELKDIANICQSVNVKKNEQIFEAKSPAESVYIVKDGLVDLLFSVTHYLSPQEITIDRKTNGEAFGWSALAEPHLYTLTAQAKKDSELIRINEMDINKLCTVNNHLGYTVMKNIAEIISQRFDLIQKILIDMIQQNLKEKEL